jgi:hypothetical protein
MDAEYWLELHSDVQHRLESAIKVFEQATEAGLTWSPEEGGTKESMRALRGELASVAHLEMRLPVVAPMKAGKSTIINAIIGEAILPVREAAMTAWPTRIELVDDIDEPLLTIHEKDAAILSRLPERLTAGVKKDFRKLADKYGSMEPLLLKVRDMRVEPVCPLYQGYQQVQEALTDLNDLLRLAAVLLPEEDVIGELFDVPTLRTPYWRRPGQDREPGPGKLILIDTPGPDEEGVAMRLTGAVQAELASCHVVLIMLDYVRMGDEAADKVKGLTDPVMKDIGPEKTYAVVNRVDQRRPGALNEAQDKDRVRRFVQVDLKLVDDRADGRIFETKGRLGLAAARVLAAMDRAGGDFSIADDQAAHAFIWEQFEDEEDREKVLADWSHDQLKERATKKWTESGIPRLLDEVVGSLRAKAVPTLLGSTLSRQKRLLKSLVDTVSVGIRSRREKTQEIRDHLNELNGEMAKLDQLRRQMPDPDQLSKQTEARLAHILAAIGEDGERILAQLDAEPVRLRIYGRRENVLSRLVRQAGDMVLQVREQAAETIGLPRPAVIMEFPSQEAADRYHDRLCAAVMPHLRAAIENGRDEIASAVGEVADEIIAEQDAKARPIVERASQRLSDAFDVQLDVPDLTISDGDIEVPKPRARKESRRFSGTRDVEKRVREWRYWLKLLPRKMVVTESYTETRKVFIVDQRMVKQELSDRFAELMKQIAHDLRNYVSGELAQRVKAYYGGLDAFLQRYQGSLKQSLQADTESEAEKKADAERLTSIHAAAKEHLEAVKGFQRQIEQSGD